MTVTSKLQANAERNKEIEKRQKREERNRILFAKRKVPSIFGLGDIITERSKRLRGTHLCHIHLFAVDTMGTVSAISDTLGLAGLAELAKDGHKPDKLYTWKYAPESDGWFRIHNALRGEMFKFKAVLEKLASTPLEPWQVSALQTYWQGHSALVHDHHDHEDKLFTPMIKTRCEYPEKLEADHDELVALMEEITGIVDELSAGRTPAALLDKFLKYKALMEPHLAEEEQTVVPILRAFFDQKEVAAKVQPMMQEMDSLLMGAFVHHQGSKTDFIKFMRQEGIPFFVWHVSFKSARAKYRAKMET